MPAETYGILLVSFSKHSHQQHFIPLYQAHPRLRIIGVADYPDIDPDLRRYNQQWASQLGVPYSEDLDESINEEPPSPSPKHPQPRSSALASERSSPAMPTAPSPSTPAKSSPAAT